MAAALEEAFKHEESHHFSDEHHNSYTLKRISQMRYRSVLTDIVLVVEGKEFPAHKNVLAASSDYFMAMFSGHMATVSEKVHVEGITASAMDLLLDFIYKGEILITEENVEDLFCGACLLLLDSVTQVCCKFIQERLDLINCWGIRALADKFNSSDLLHRVNTFLQENFKEAVQLDEFLLLRAEDLDEFLQDDDIVIDREEDLFDLLVKWLNHDLGNRQGHFPTLLRKIRLPQINKKHLEQVISLHEAVVNDPEACKVVADARRHQHYAFEASDEDTYDSTWMEPRRCLSGITGLLTVAGFECVFYDINANTWRPVAGLSTRHCPGIEAMGKYVYVVGGSKEWRRMNSCERYDPNNNRWQSMKPMNVSCSNVGLVCLDGLLYAVGGYDGRSPKRKVECYDPHKNEWKFVAPMNNCRDGACVVTDGRLIYAISGYDGSNYLSSVEVYDPVRDNWNIGEFAPIIERREDAMAAVLENTIYVLGGYHGNSFMASCEGLNLETNSWDFKASMSAPRYQAGVAVLNKKIFVCGGWSGSGLATSSVECYDASTDTWFFVAPLPTPSAARSAFCMFPPKEMEKIIRAEEFRKTKPPMKTSNIRKISAPY